MANDANIRPELITVRDNIEFKCVSYGGGSKMSKMLVSAGIFENYLGKELVHAKNYGKFLALDELKERLKSPECRQADQEALKNRDSPFLILDMNGTDGRIPGRLISTNKPYDDKVDEAQLRIWKNVVTNLGGKPAETFNPMFARSLLRPSDDLKKKAGNDLLYCSPAKSAPAFGVTTDKLKTVIDANSGNFDGWPDPVVIDYETAEADGLMLVGYNFLQFYFVWMKAEYYAQLWNQFGVTQLLHALPDEGEEETYKDVDDNTLITKTKRSGQPVDGVVTPISSMTLGARNRKSDGSGTKSVMGTNAKTVADKLWTSPYITSGMGKNSQGDISTVEWLHRVAFSLGGKDVFKNLVFGTWECNTTMMRAEQFVKELIKKNKPRDNYQGRLQTVNKTTGITRSGLQGEDTTATVPTWAENYSWLCFCLTYRYQMDPNNCPLSGLDTVLHEVNFDPWSIYVPLSMEPRLDIMILNNLKGGDTVSVADSDAPEATEGVAMQPVALNMKGNTQPLPNLPLPEDHARTYSTLAWNAAVNRLPYLRLPGIVIINPRISVGPLPDDETADPQGGFVLQGEIDVFGTGVVGNMEKWFGPPPDDVVVGTDPPSIERVVIQGDIHMSMLIPLLAGTPFDDIIFRNVAISHQNYAYDKSKSIGWHFNADWVIDSSCGLLYDILTTALQVDKLTLSIHAAFGEDLDWDAPLNLQSFILEGVFPNLTLSPVPGLTLTSVGVRLLGIRGFSFAPQPHSTLSFDFGIFGTMKLGVPGSVVPLNLNYEIGLAGSTVALRAEISGLIWEDALGVKGLLLEDVAFGTTFTATSTWDSFAFDVSATFWYMTSEVYLQGSYAAGGNFSLTAEFDNLGVNEIDNLFYSVLGDFLTLPDFNLNIGSATISVSNQGLAISLLDVQVAGYTVASVALALSSLGVSLSGALSSSAITLGDVELRDPSINLSFWTVGKNKKVDLMLSGSLGVDFLDLAIGAVVHLYPGEDGVEWTVVAELSTPGQPFAISNVVPEVKDTFVDFSLSDAMIIAASQDDPLVSQSYPQYNVRKGVQVFALIDSIPAINKLLGEDVLNLVLNAGWSKASGFSLFISLPAESTINFGNGIKTTPITLGITTSPPELAIIAGVTIPVKDSETPLDFSFMLAANVTEAIASAQMDGWWVKPFGIDNLKIGPEVTLSIEIIYEQFVSTGLPSGFGVQGGLMIGKTAASLAFNISEDPTREFLYAHVKSLAISDVVMFAGTLLQQNIPRIPDDLLKFEELQVYICPYGVMLGKTAYPQGFSFKSDLLLFEKRANIECKIDKAQLSVDIVGGIDNFELGPLTVRGADGPRATLECHVGVAKQQLVVDGVVCLFDAEVQTYINVEFLPDPTFKFYLLLEFADIFMFKLDAELLGSIYDRLSDADFSLHAELEDDILEFIEQQVTEQFEAAKVAVEDGLEAAQAVVDEAEQEWEAAIAEAQKKLDEAQKEWEAFEQGAWSSNQQIIDDYLSEITRLEGEVDKTRKAFDKAMDSAERAVNQANQDRSAKLATAERAVDNAKRNMDKAVDGAQRHLDDAAADLSRLFGNIQRDIDNAQQEVWSLQNQIDALKRTIDEYEDAPWYRFDLKAEIPALWVAVGVLEASKAVASGILDAARAVLKGSEYVAKEGVVKTAGEALSLARSTGDTALSTAQTALSLADTTSKAVLDAANTALDEVKKGADFTAFERAKEALELFKKGNELAYKAAVAVIEGLMDTVEFIAFNAAKAELEAAKASTAVLDAAKEALAEAEEASETALSIVEEVSKYALNIKTIVLSGTLRGILGMDGTDAQPLSAVITGSVAGHSFCANADFDPREAVEFITAIFKKLWDLVLAWVSLSKKPLTRIVVEQRHHVKRGAISEMTQPGSSLAARSRFLQQRPDVLRILTDKSKSTFVPRGPFSGNPILPSLVVARRASMLIQKKKGLSLFDDLAGRQR